MPFLARVTTLAPQARPISTPADYTNTARHRGNALEVNAAPKETKSFFGIVLNRFTAPRRKQTDQERCAKIVEKTMQKCGVRGAVAKDLTARYGEAFVSITKMLGTSFSGNPAIYATHGLALAQAQVLPTISDDLSDQDLRVFQKSVSEMLCKEFSITESDKETAKDLVSLHLGGLRHTQAH
jgi:hypothetical protein